VERFAGEDDSALLARAQGGGPRAKEAYSELVRRHQSWLVRLVAQLTRVPQADAEDLAQEAFVRSYVGLDRMPSDVNFRAWVRVSAMRLAYNARRDRATRERLNQTLDKEESVTTGDAFAARQMLEQVLGELTYSYREILLLRHVEELSLEEIAALLNIGLSAAKMRLTRARAAFVESHDALMEHSA